MLKPEDCKPGTVVECCLKLSPDNPAVLGALYTIADIAEGFTNAMVWEVGVVFSDLPNMPRSKGYDRRGFRIPPDERLAVFCHMLAPIKQKPAAFPGNSATTEPLLAQSRPRPLQTHANAYTE